MVVQNYMKKINLYTTKKDLRLEFFVTYRGWGRKVWKYNTTANKHVSKSIVETLEKFVEYVQC